MTTVGHNVTVTSALASVAAAPARTNTTTDWRRHAPDPCNRLLATPDP